MGAPGTGSKLRPGWRFPSLGWSCGLPFFTVSVLFCRIEADHITVCRIRVRGQARDASYRLSEESKMSLLRRLLAAVLAVHALTCSAQPAGPAVATFAGGCCWCMEAPYDAFPGRIYTTSDFID